MTLNRSLSKTYRARLIVPICAPVVHDGVITIVDRRVAAIETFKGQSEAIDLGDVAVLPGLINAHTHLEFSDLDAPIGNIGMSIADWLPEVVCRRKAQHQSDADRAAAIVSGIDESIRCGTRLLGEIATKPWPRGAVASAIANNSSVDPMASHLQITCFCEILGLSDTRQHELLEWMDSQISSQWSASIQLGISPHAPYSVPISLLGSCISRAQQHGLPLAIHIAESMEERRFIEQGDGPLRDTFESLGLSGLNQFPFDASLEDLIEQIAKAPSGLLVHGNYLTTAEIDCIARHRKKLSVVYCPRTHAFFDHLRHPVDQLIDAGICVALGTDSRASNPDLNLWSEVRHLLMHRQDLNPRQVVAMATRCGADALGQPNFGRLKVGACGDLFVLKTRATSEAQFWDTLVDAEPFLSGREFWTA